MIEIVEKLPQGRTADVLCGQLLKAATSVGYNYRAACRAKSLADFISKMGPVEEESDESVYCWMELLVGAKIVQPDKLEALMRKGNEILAIAVSSIITARRKRRDSRDR